MKNNNDVNTPADQQSSQEWIINANGELLTERYNPRLDPANPSFDPLLFSQQWERFRRDLKAMVIALEQIGAFEPFLEAEIAEANKQAGTPINIDDVLALMTSHLEPITKRNGEPIKNPYIDLIQRAKDRQKAAMQAGEERQKSKRTRAKEAGAIVDGIERLCIPSAIEYRHALTAKTTTGEAGLLYIGADDTEAPALNVDTAFCSALLTTIDKDCFANGYNKSNGLREVTVYIPQFLKSLGIDATAKHKENTAAAPKISRTDARSAIINRTIQQLDSLAGVLPGSAERFKLLAVHSYNPETEMLTFASPYLQRIYANTDKYCWLIHADAASGRNELAFEVVTQILSGLLRRGATPPDEKIKGAKKKGSQNELPTYLYSISCAGLIEQCPKLKARYDAYNTGNEKTKLLKRTFASVYKILREKTDLFAYYLNVQIEEVLPTSTTLNAKIKITHNGINPNAPQRPFYNVQSALIFGRKDPQ